MSDELNQQMIDQMRNLSDVMAASGQTTLLQTEILKKLAAAQGIQVNNIKGLDTAFGTLKGNVSAQSAAYEANKKAAEEYTKAMGNFNAALGSAGKSLGSLAGAALSTEKSFAKYNSALSSAGDAALSLGKNFGLLGLALGGLVKGVTFAAEQFTKQADATLKATDDLSKMGAAGALTANNVLDMAHNAGLSSKNLEVFTKAAERANTGLAGLGVTVGDGVKAFGQMTAISAEQRMAFQRLGVSQEALMSQQADYVKLQEMSGKSMATAAKDGNTLRKQSLEYAENLARLSALTGKSADKLQEEQNAAMMEYEEIVATRIEDDKIRKLKAEGRKDEAKALEDEQAARKAYITQVTNQLGKDAGLKVARVARTGSFEESTAGIAALGLTPDQIQQGFKGKSVQQAQEGAAAFTQSVKEQQSVRLGQLGTALQYGGEGLGNQFFLGKESLQATGKLAERNETEAEAEARRRTQGAAAGAATAGGVAATDPAQIARNKLTELEIKAQVELDKFIQKFNPLLNGFNAATIAATALAAAATAAAVALGIIAGKSALSKLGGDGGEGKGGGKGGGKGESKGGGKGESKGGGKGAGKFGKFGRLAKGLGGAGAVVGGALALKEGYDQFQDIDELQKTGDISKSQATLRKSEAVGTGVGSAAGGAGGAWGGAVAGAAVGSVVPVVGTVIGGILGAAVGGWLGSKGGEIIGSKVGAEAGRAMGGTTARSESASVDPRRVDRGSSPALGAAPGGGVQSSADQLKNAGLVLKRGDVQKEGAELDPNLIEIAKQIQAQVPGFVQFTGFNDQFHSENAPGSLHSKGKAFDFVVNKKPTKEEGEKIKALMKQLGVDYAIDEYNSPSGHATGGHFHGQLKAYDGGVFEGPGGGYNVEMHNREAIVPLPNPDSVISVENPQAQKKPLSSVMADSNTITSASTSDMMADMMAKMMDVLTSKLDTMIDHMSDSNSIQDKIYKVSSV